MEKQESKAAPAFTPGPWRLRPFDESQTVVLPPEGSESGLLVCIVDRMRLQGEANARLIAAAPEMYAALEALHAWDARIPHALGGPECLEDVVILCRAASARARGEEA